MLREMSRIIAEQAGVVDVPDLFAIVIGPSSLIVDGDVTFANDLDVPAVEQTISRPLHSRRNAMAPTKLGPPFTGVWPRIRPIARADSSGFTKNPAAGLSAISSA